MSMVGDGDFGSKSRLRVLLEHFGRIEDPRDVRRILHPLPGVLLLVVCGTMADCDDYENISAWGAAHLPFLRRYLPFEHGVPGDRWLTILMNRVDPALFSAAFTAWVRASFPRRADFVAIDGKTSRRSHDRRAGTDPIHLVSAFATTVRLVLAQEAVPDKANELAAIPVLLERLGANGGLAGALVSIDAIATDSTVAAAIRATGADYLLSVKANQSTLRAEVEAAFAEADPATLKCRVDTDKEHGRVEERRVAVLREGRLALRRSPVSGRDASARRRFDRPCRNRRPPRRQVQERYPLLHLLRRAHHRTGRRGRPRPLGHRESAPLGARRSLPRRPVPPPNRPGAANMAVVRHFALNLVRSATDKKSRKTPR